jgi:hypothetical protein
MCVCVFAIQNNGKEATKRRMRTWRKKMKAHMFPKRNRIGGCNKQALGLNVLADIYIYIYIYHTKES